MKQRERKLVVGTDRHRFMFESRIGTQKSGAMYSRNVETQVGTADELSWYAVSSRSRHEKLVAAAFTNTGITAFLPLVSEMHSWTYRPKLVDVPLFPGTAPLWFPTNWTTPLVLSTRNLASAEFGI